MSDQDKNPENNQAEVGEVEVEVELFDPWEQRFKFEPMSRLYGHVIGSERAIQSNS